MTFDTFGLVEPLVRAVREKGYKIPTPIQSATLENVLKGRDLMASAQTGTGKTAAFTLPLLQRLAGSLNKNKHISQKPLFCNHRLLMHDLILQLKKIPFLASNGHFRKMTDV